uniref:aspartyl protease family protein n=2 Tax=Gelidibacter sp. TaxID=2018083 RepID=UPI00404B061D
MLNKYTFIFLLLSITFFSFSQGRFDLPRSEFTKIKFELINNLIVFPVEVNGAKLSFLLDSGVSKPILFNIINMSDSIQINHVESIYLRGLGDGGFIEALRSKHNIFKLGDAINVNQEIYVIFDESINFTPRLGVVVHGIIGYDIFRDFIVEINYASKYIKLHNPKTYKYRRCKKCQTFDLELNQNKPYINAKVEMHSKQIPVKLLIDSGGSDALWLFEEDSLGIYPDTNKYFHDFLGKGLSGSVHGKRTKIHSFSISDFNLKDVNVAFPDSSAISLARKFKERNGSVAGEILKRFNMIIDYNDSKITLKKNKNFKLPFQYNMSGVVIEQDGMRVVMEKKEGISVGKDSYGNTNEGSKTISIVESYKFVLKPTYRIVELRNNSPAKITGLLLGDVILKINGKETHHLKMNDINEMLRANEGDILKIKVDRNGKELEFALKIESLF